MSRIRSWMRIGRSHGPGALVGAVALVALSATSASAIGANFADNGSKYGFEYPGEGLDALPQAGIGLDDPFLVAVDPANATPFPDPVSVELVGTAEPCILVGASSACQPGLTGAEDDWSALISFRVNVLDDDLTGPFTLIMRQLETNYDASEVSVILDPTAPSGLDTSGAAPGFEFDPSNGVGGFSPFVVLRDEAYASQGVIDYFLGFTVRDGDLVTYRFDVDPDGAGDPATPSLEFRWSAVPVVVPEPGTAVLMGLGLGGLALAGSRRDS